MRRSSASASGEAATRALMSSPSRASSCRPDAVLPHQRRRAPCADPRSRDASSAQAAKARSSRCQASKSDPQTLRERGSLEQLAQAPARAARQRGRQRVHPRPSPCTASGSSSTLTSSSSSEAISSRRATEQGRRRQLGLGAAQGRAEILDRAARTCAGVGARGIPRGCRAPPPARRRTRARAGAAVSKWGSARPGSAARTPVRGGAGLVELVARRDAQRAQHRDAGARVGCRARARCAAPRAGTSRRSGFASSSGRRCDSASAASPARWLSSSASAARAESRSGTSSIARR